MPPTKELDDLLVENRNEPEGEELLYQLFYEELSVLKLLVRQFFQNF